MSGSDQTGLQTPITVEPCWRTIGVAGDGSCSQLASVIHCHNCPVFSDSGQQLFERPLPPERIAEQTARLAEEVGQEFSDNVALLVFRIADEWLALDVDAIVEVATPRALHRVPYRTSDAFLGIVNLRGELQLCVSLRALLGIPAADPLAADQSAAPHATRTAACRLIVCQGEGQRWVFAADEVAGVQQVGTHQLGSVPATVAKGPRRLASGVFRWGERHVGRLDSQRLFAAWREVLR
ncbi:MAG: chemotaxis protein CheW [Pirellulaceae bacterium]|nr:chemotaxis protein CheW [Pirellulaceae bacterium]